MADKIVVMNAGRVEQIGSPLDLYDRPANLFVAGFLGSPAMNFIQGSVAPGGLELRDGTLLPLAEAAPAPLEQQVVFGIRPEHLEMVSAGGHAATVVLTEPTGAETHVVLDLAGEQFVGVFKERLAIEPGQTVQVAFAPGKGHFFDAAGARF